MTTPATTPLGNRLRGRSELGIAALLGAVGGLVLWDAAGLHAPSERDGAAERMNGVAHAEVDQ